MVRVVWAHAVAIVVWGLVLGYAPWHAALDSAPVAIAGVAAAIPGLSRRIRAAAVCVGLLSSSAVVVHLMDGAVEGHFHFFVMVTLLALYEEWFPYLLAIAFVLAHHGLMGTLDPSGVINHPDAAAHPWRWAAVHAAFITGLSIVNLISWRLQEQERARTASSKERLRWAFEDAPTGMAFVGLDGVMSTANAALCRLTGFAAADLVGKPLGELIAEQDRAAGAFPAPDRREEELRYRRRDGSTGWGLWHHSLILGDAQEPVGWVSHCVDISERKDAEQRLSWRASHDGLTGLPNRALFMRRVTEELKRRRGNHDEGRVALLFVDIDNFKDINDSLGHTTGDRLLNAVADRLRGILRGGDVIGRFGGDEFTILLPGTRDEADAKEVAARLVQALRAPLLLGDDEVSVSASVGLAFAGADETTDPEALLRDADAAMYRAKARGKGRLEVFDSSARDATSERLALEGALRGALDRGELRLVYQPLVALEDGRVTGVEALLRWHHPALGVVPPLRFIPVAEANGLIVSIGAWVVREACRRLAEWPDDSLAVWVNVSARQLDDGAFAEVVRTALRDSDVRADRLVLEITESAMLSDSRALGHVLLELKALGVRLAVDDFGVGHASLDRLRALLPLDTLKIDRSFVDGITSRSADAAIVEGVVRLAHSLGLEAVAEGVESAEQAGLLRSWGCRMAQGYHFSRPVEADRIEQIVATPVAPAG